MFGINCVGSLKLNDNYKVQLQTFMFHSTNQKRNLTEPSFSLNHCHTTVWGNVGVARWKVLGVVFNVKCAVGVDELILS